MKLKNLYPLKIMKLMGCIEKSNQVIKCICIYVCLNVCLYTKFHKLQINPHPPIKQLPKTRIS
mgnify:CR=1 FL=1